MTTAQQKYPQKRAKIRPEVNEIYAKYLFNCRARHVILFGGAGSGKSVAASQLLSVAINTQHTTKHKILCIRKVYGDIRESMYDRILNELDSHGLGSRFKSTKQPLKIAKKPPRGQEERHQSSFVFRGMDNPEKVKSIEGVTMIWIEEATELTEKEFLQLDLRLRGATKHYYQLIMSFNPVSKDHWIAKYAEPQMLKKEDRVVGTGEVRYLVPNKVWEYDRLTEVDGKEVSITTRVLNTTAEDNRWISDEYKATLNNMAGADELMYKVYKQGRWGVLNKDGLYVPSYDRKKHVRPSSKLMYDPKLPIHLTLDFNVVPYMSALVIQEQYVEQGYWNGHTSWIEVRVVDEICTESPHNTAQGMAKMFEARYPTISGFFLYGDATGKARTGIEGIMGVQSLFDDFKLGLGSHRGLVVERVPTVNPRYKAIAKGALGRHAFQVRLFGGKTVPIRILIADHCKNFIMDVENCKVAANGSMLKEKDSKGWEKWGHLLNAWEYFSTHPKTYGKYAFIGF